MAPEPTVVVTVTGAPAAGVVVTVTVTVSVIYLLVSLCNQESTLSQYLSQVRPHVKSDYILTMQEYAKPTSTCHQCSATRELKTYCWVTRSGDEGDSPLGVEWVASSIVGHQDNNPVTWSDLVLCDGATRQVSSRHLEVEGHPIGPYQVEV